MFHAICERKTTRNESSTPTSWWPTGLRASLSFQKTDATTPRVVHEKTSMMIVGMTEPW